MSKIKALLTLLSLFMTSTIVIAFVIAQPRIVGVSIGDWFKYGDLSVQLSSNDPNATVPLYLEKMNQTEWISLTVLDVSNTNMTVQFVIHLENGTEETSEGYVDIDTGDGVNATNWIISADLNENDTVYSSGMFTSWTINETTTRTYPDGARETNHINFTSETNNTGSYEYESINIYWDRLTGVFVELSQNTTTQIGENITTILVSYKITDSDVWVIPEVPTCAPFLMLVVLTTATILLKRRTLKHQHTN
jgi:hypothetical protein